MKKQGEIVAEPARALRERRRRGQGHALQQRRHAGARARFPARPRRLHDPGRDRAQGEPRRPRPPARLSRPRRRELPQAHADHLVDGKVQLDWKPVTITRFPPTGEDLLMSQRSVAAKTSRHHGRAPEDLALRLAHRRAQAGGVRGRGARVGVPARRARHHQGQARRDARLPQELPDDDLRLLRDAHGRPGRARLQGADGADRRGRPRAGDLGDGEPADRQGPRRRHGALLGQDPRGQAVARPRLRRDRREGADRLAAADERDRRRSRSASCAAAASASATRWRPIPVPRPGRARQGLPLRRRPARGRAGRAPGRAERRARHLGLHALLLLQRALPEGRRSARRDRQARRRVDQGGDRPRHGRQAREVVHPLGDDDRLAARDRARAEDAGDRRGDQADRLRARAWRSRARCRRRSRRTWRTRSTRRAASTTS